MHNARFARAKAFEANAAVAVAIAVATTRASLPLRLMMMMMMMNIIIIVSNDITGGRLSAGSLFNDLAVLSCFVCCSLAAHDYLRPAKTSSSNLQRPLVTLMLLSLGPLVSTNTDLAPKGDLEEGAAVRK